VTARTGFVEVIIDGVIGFSPGGLSADLGLLAVQPPTGVCGVIRGAPIKNVVDIPFAVKAAKNLVVAVVLSSTASIVGSGISTFEDLNSS